MNTLIIFLTGLLIYTGVYTILDRVCKCIEFCARVKAYSVIGGNVDAAIDKLSNKAD